jgi:hypothetical protein
MWTIPVEPITKALLSMAFGATRYPPQNDEIPAMQEREASIENLEALHMFVHELLCESENLLADQFQTTHRCLFSRDQLCGIEYSLQGLRSVRLGAIWASDQNAILVYNARGERCLKVRLTQRPQMTPSAGSSLADSDGFGRSKPLQDESQLAAAG